MGNVQYNGSLELTALRGVGPSTKAKLARLNIFTSKDLLLHFPFRYQDRTRSTPFNAIQINQEQLVTGEVLSISQSSGYRKSLLIALTDKTGFLNIRLFHFNPFQRHQIKAGMHMRCFGAIRYGHSGIEMVHPEYVLSETAPPEPSPELTPVYHSTEGLSQNKIRALCNQVLDMKWEVPSTKTAVPDTPKGAGMFTKVSDAIHILHHPPPDISSTTLDYAREKVAYEEFIAHFLASKLAKVGAGQQLSPKLPSTLQLGKQLLSRLGFDLTNAQKRVSKEILLELESDQPMLRLLQGDVGSGKTIVAAFAAVRAAENKYQTALLVPTEILAEQHFLTFSRWLAPLDISVTLLTGKLGKVKKRNALKAISSGGAQVIIGTHALFQSSVKFYDLALIIVDEQHRFGVEQRLSLRNKFNHSSGTIEQATRPHQLVMTATPIPRTLTMTLYAGMDISIIDELPSNRLPIETRVISDNRKAEVINSLNTICGKGNQVYWVCTLIEESEQIDSTAAESAAAELTKCLPDLKVGLIHGRFSTADKNNIMQQFTSGQLDILVATTVVEVGVDVPNASLIVIENAERLGLTQLHQLRGRVGRGTDQSHCILLYSSPLSITGKERLKVMRATTDGFRIAEEDLKLRGPGDLLGTRQTGEQLFRVANIFDHAHLMQDCMIKSEHLLSLHPLICKEIINFWSDQKQEYTDV